MVERVDKSENGYYAMHGWSDNVSDALVGIMWLLWKEFTPKSNVYNALCAFIAIKC